MRPMNRPDSFEAHLRRTSVRLLAFVVVAMTPWLDGCSMLQTQAPTPAPAAAPAPSPPPSLGTYTLAATWSPGGLLRATVDPGGRHVAATLAPVPSTQRQNPPRVLIHDLSSGEDMGPFELRDRGHSVDRAIPITYSPDGSLLAVGSTGTVFLLQASDGTQLKVMRYAEGRAMLGVGDLAFSPDGKRVIALTGPTVVVWDVASGAVVAHWATGEEYARRLAVSPDGKLLATGGDSGIVLRRLGDGSIVCNGSPGRILGVAFSPDGRRVAGWAYDATFRVMDAACGSQAQWPGEARFVPTVAFRDDGASLLGVGNDGTIRAWDVAAHSVLSSAPVTGKGPFTVQAFDRDHRLLLVDLGNHAAQVWASPGDAG